MNKLGTKLGAIAMSAVMALSFAPSAAITSLAADDGLDDAKVDSLQEVYVVYDENSGEHLWTTQAAEVSFLLNNGWSEGNPSWKVPVIAGDPVYRLYSPSTGEHHYTANTDEVKWLVDQGWTNEKIAFLTPDPKDDGAIPVLCYRNPEGGRGAHQYTISEEEAAILDVAGWTKEDPRFYGYELTYEPGPVVEELTVSINNTTPKVGDTLVATVEPDDAVVSYQWYADGEEIEDATDDELLITPDMVGSKISVAVMDADGNSDLSDETEEVGVYEALEILSAEQTGANTVKVTFSAPVTTDDELEVFKGSVEKTIASQEFVDDTFTSKILTMKDNFANGTYTVVLTPADDDVDPSSVDFEAESGTKAGELEIVGDKLVMKDTTFEEGYFFIKGYNGIGDENDGKGEEVPLSGLLINVGPSDSVSFDSSTGKVTVKYKDPGFAVVRNVSVFAQYTGADSQIITASKTLEVSTIGYPSAIEFGEIKKEGETKTYDEIELSELSSNKYYVELNSVKDQYENDLSAEDLNDLVDDRLLTVIPSADSPIYFGTNDSAFSEKDGKVVVFLTPNNNKRLPGVGQLMITGAGGSFSKDVTIVDNSYIDVLNVEIPDLYEAQTSDEFTFSAVDEYGVDLDLYQYAPRAGKSYTTLKFTDKNNLTGKETTITAENGGEWNVKKDTVNKTFTVTYKPVGKAKSIATFTIITAGMETRVRTITIGSKGTSATIVDPGAAKTIAAGKDSNIASYIQFKDANGKVMDRIDDAGRYPRFLYDTTITTNSKIKDEDIKNYYWTVSSEKLLTNSGDAVALPAGAFMDQDAVINAAALGATYTNEDKNLGLDGKKNVTPSYYVSLLGETGGAYRVLDSQAFRFVYIPTSMTGLKFSVADTSSKLLYAHPDSEDSEKLEVVITNDAGETFKVDADQVTADAPFTTDGAKVIGTIDPKIGDGTLSAKVYITNPETGKIEAVDTVGIAYSDDDPVATTTSTKLTTTDAKGDGSAPEGKDWEPDGRTELETSNSKQAEVSFDGKTLTIKNATVWNDTFTAEIKDQYDVAMSNSDVEIDGKPLAKNANYPASDNGVNIVMTNGSKKIDITLYVGTKGLKTNKATGSTTSSVTVSDEDTLNAALATAPNFTKLTVTLDKSITTSKTLTIPKKATLVVPSGYVLNTGAENVEVNGTLKVNGQWIATGTAGTVINGSGTIEGTGHATLTGTTLGGTVTSTLNGTTLVLKAVKFSGAWKLGGHVRLEGAVDFDSIAVQLLNSLTLTLATDAAPTNATALVMADNAKVNLEILADKTEMTYVANTEDGTSATVELTTGGLDGDDLSAVNSEFTSIVDLWIALAGLEEADADTAADLKEAQDKYSTLTTSDKTAFDAALKQAISDTKLNTKSAIETHVTGLIAAYESAAEVKSAVDAYVTLAGLKVADKDTEENHTTAKGLYTALDADEKKEFETALAKAVSDEKLNTKDKIDAYVEELIAAYKLGAAETEAESAIAAATTAYGKLDKTAESKTAYEKACETAEAKVTAFTSLSGDAEGLDGYTAYSKNKTDYETARGVISTLDASGIEPSPLTAGNLDTKEKLKTAIVTKINNSKITASEVDVDGMELDNSKGTDGTVDAGDIWSGTVTIRKSGYIKEITVDGWTLA